MISFPVSWIEELYFSHGFSVWMQYMIVLKNTSASAKSWSHIVYCNTFCTAMYCINIPKVHLYWACSLNWVPKGALGCHQYFGTSTVHTWLILGSRSRGLVRWTWYGPYVPPLSVWEPMRLQGKSWYKWWCFTLQNLIPKSYFNYTSDFYHALGSSYTDVFLYDNICILKYCNIFFCFLSYTSVLQLFCMKIF